MATRKSTVSSSKATGRRSASSKAVSQAVSDPSDSPETEIFRQIRERAYFKAQQRGFAAGHELEDWYEAERELQSASAQSTVH